MASNNKTTEIRLDIDESLANAIRKSVNEIPVLAIEDVEIYKNDSALYDEILAHRLGLIPLKDIRKLNEREKCQCKGKGCTKCELQLSLKAKGQKNVYSGELKGDIEVVYDKIPLVFLDEEQELEIVCFARLGKATTHTKFSPGLVYFRNSSEIKIKDAEKASKEKLGINTKEKLKNGETYISEKNFDYLEAISDGSFEVSPGKEIIFCIEPWGQMKCRDIFIEAVKAMNSNLKEVLKTIKK